MNIVFKSRRFFLIILFLILSFLFIFVSPSYVVPALINVISFFLVISGVLKLTLASVETHGIKEYRLDIIEGILFIICGIISIKFKEYEYTTVVLGILLIFIPIIRIILSVNKTNILLMDSLKYLTIIIFILNNNITSRIMCIMLGLLFLVIAGVITKTLVNKINAYKNFEKGEL